MADTASYKRYANMQESNISWLGKTPKEWPFLRLKSIFQIQKNIVGELGHDVLSITQKGIKKKDTISGEGQLSMDYSKYQRVSPGDFAMNHMDLLTGYVDISKQHGVTSPDYRVFKLVHTESVPRYWLYVLQLCYKAKIFFPLGQGAAHIGRWRLPTEGFNQFVCVVPSIGEQQKIANFLDHQTAKIDTLIEKQQQLIKLLKEKRQAVISHAVTKGLNPDAPMKDSGVEWLGEVPEGWVVCALKHVASVIDCKHITAEFIDDGVPLASIGEVKDKYVNLISSKRTTQEYYLELISGGRKPTQGDLIFSRNATVGEVAIVEKDEEPFAMGQDVCLIRRYAGVLPEFLYYLLTSSATARQLDLLMIGSTFKRINVDDIRNFDITIPSVKLQSKIVSHITLYSEELDRQLEKAVLMVDLLAERRTALISAAVTGKIDVRNWQPPTKQTTSSKDV